MENKPCSAFFSVIHSATLPFLEKFTESLEQQTTQNFDLVIVNDGVSSCSLDVFSRFEERLHVLEGVGDTVLNRKIGVDFLLNAGFKNIVFGDSDDYISPNRISSSSSLLDKYPVVVSEIDIIDRFGSGLFEGLIRTRCPDLTKFSDHDLVESNFVGLGNSAVRAECLECIDWGSSSGALDWFVFAQVMDGRIGILDTSSKVYYRQYDDNIASILAPSLKQVQRTLEVKAQHYNDLARIIPRYSSVARSYLKAYHLIVDSRALNNYYSWLRDKVSFPSLWWETGDLEEFIRENQLK